MSQATPGVNGEYFCSCAYPFLDLRNGWVTSASNVLRIDQPQPHSTVSWTTTRNNPKTRGQLFWRLVGETICDEEKTWPQHCDRLMLLCDGWFSWALEAGDGEMRPPQWKSYGGSLPRSRKNWPKSSLFRHLGYFVSRLATLPMIRPPLKNPWRRHSWFERNVLGACWSCACKYRCVYVHLICNCELYVNLNISFRRF